MLIIFQQRGGDRIQIKCTLVDDWTERLRNPCLAGDRNSRCQSAAL
jgi:hypothetical protein